MITKSIKPLILTILILSITLFLTQLIRDELVYNRNLISDGEIWRIISGNFTHSNLSHLLLNLAGLWIFGFIFMDNLKTKTFIFCTLFLSISVGVGLYLFTPELIKYYGFSGVLYGLFICGGSKSIIQKDFFTGFSIIIFIFAKVAWDLHNGGNASSEALIGIPVAVDAHLYGILGATLISVAFFINHKFKIYTPPTF